MPSERWVRGVRGDTTVVDSRRPVLVWEPGVPVPGYAFPEEDVRTDLLRAGEAVDGVVFYDLLDRDETVERAAWTYPDLPGHIAFGWFRHPAGVLDHWYEEDEEIFVHPRDPYKRVDPIPSSRHIRVEIAGQVVADTHRPVLLFETGLPTRYYIPPDDVDFDLLEATRSHTRCPYKGIASYWSFRDVDAGVPADIAWAYPAPIPAAAQIKDHVAFYNEAVDIVVDGQKLDRPVTVFSGQLA
ncbi:hypothetical protein Pmi06nite_63710 [Planotetraspora mira]|uniref:DUF427 domain-containing protein n=1 Tax=Planotetraspora mira TaxID=58121 RepID=A0A8J3XAB1_9ACTN|nr:hypothetical protein Pmi06nite_63710 [Planotetraspora mira]